MSTAKLCAHLRMFHVHTCLATRTVKKLRTQNNCTPAEVGNEHMCIAVIKTQIWTLQSVWEQSEGLQTSSPIYKSME
jgi:hypothetical protein